MRSRRRRRRGPVSPYRIRQTHAVVALLLLAAPFVGGCDEDSGDENFETPNEVDGGSTDGTPAGDVDSTGDGS